MDKRIITNYINGIYQDRESFKKLFSISLGLSHYTSGSRETIKHSLLWSMRDLLIKYPVYVESDPASNILFANAMPISMRGPRQDYSQNFQTICRLVMPRDVIRLVDVEKDSSVTRRIIKRLSLIKSVCLLCTVPKYISLVKRHRFSFTEALYCLPDWFNLSDFAKTIKKIDLSKYRLIVTFCDAEPRQNLLTQIANCFGCDTATLQHGMFCAPMKNATSAEEEGVELKGVVSKYFLAWNGLTKDYAIETGIPEDAIRIVGNPKFVDDGDRCFSPKNRNCFGVILGNLAFDRDNRKLIEIANETAKILNMRFYLKYHPVVSDTYYSEMADDQYCVGSVERGIALPDYIDKIDFSIVGQSSMFVELIHMGHPTFHMHDDTIADKFELAEAISFQTPEELCRLWQENHGVTDELALYLAGPQNVARQYVDFFDLYREDI